MVNNSLLYLFGNESLHERNTSLKYTAFARATFLPALRLVLYGISPTTASPWRSTTHSLRPAASSQTFREQLFLTLLLFSSNVGITTHPSKTLEPGDTRQVKEIQIPTWHGLLWGISHVPMMSVLPPWSPGTLGEQAEERLGTHIRTWKLYSEKRLE